MNVLIPFGSTARLIEEEIQVFVNAKGGLTVVNVVPLEEYLLGVVPSELGLPAIEAQGSGCRCPNLCGRQYRRLRQARL